MYALYTYGLILVGPNKYQIDHIIKELQEANLDITIEGDLQYFLMVNIGSKAGGMIYLTQLHLINQIVKDLKLEVENVITKPIPASSSRLLSRHS